ncbi:glutamate carboxypeptidase [Haloactinopolyspora alba]|uniref:Glutamate carboxypeptidase n=1 Tax=Haloactinopolyspora alba TaxID=648780 RepID=A0A2P8E5N1_9ACTN|nr:M20/M25/M40 family metallo-hydrolase [Haloactinopolyspora alba]PSL04784.1 glutamate carboxypeptidase [Haloactinopolyspora alba]
MDVHGPDTAAMTERLEQYVRHETPTGDAARLDALADLLLDRHHALGADVRRVDSETGDHLVMEHPGAGDKADDAPVLFVGHHDTVWPAGHLEDAMPWRIDDGVAHGPGVFDMKSGLVVMETALETVRARGVAHRPVRVVIVADEEVGSPSSTELVASCADGAAVALGFESPHPDGALKVGRRGSSRVRVSVRGRASHAALDPGAGVSAVDELVDQLVRVRALVADAPGEVLCNVGTLVGGGKTNVVPAEAGAEIGLRFLDAETERVVLDGLTGLHPVRSGADVITDVLTRRPTWTSGAGEQRLMDVVRAAAASVRQEVTRRPAAGAADTNTTGALGLPTVDGLGPRGAGAHAAHEQAVLASLPERAELVAALLTDL